MSFLDKDDLKYYKYDELSKLKTWLNDYIVTIEKESIKWQVLSFDELQEFFKNNYYDNTSNEFVYWYESDDRLPIGMYFLTYPKRKRDIKYFVGTIKNNLNKETIIGCISYNDDCQIGENCDLVTSIEGVEINYFYRGQGLLKKLISEFSKVVDKNQNILVTNETPMGKKYQVMRHLQDGLMEHNFNADIRFEDEIDDAYLEKITRK